MRYPAEHKERVRERIVRAAARRFRARGSADVAIADLMRDLTLTHGGFYRHFRGKEHLFTEAFEAAAAETRSKMEAAAARAAPGQELEAIVHTYLSDGHCQHPDQGCPIAALAADVTRHPRRTRVALDRAVRANAAALARFMPGDTPADREQHAMLLFAGMAGTLTLARATADQALRRTLLEAARRFYGGGSGRRP